MKKAATKPKRERGPTVMLWISEEIKAMYAEAMVAAGHEQMSTWIKVVLRAEAVRLLGKERVAELLKKGSDKK